MKRLLLGFLVPSMATLAVGCDPSGSSLERESSLIIETDSASIRVFTDSRGPEAVPTVALTELNATLEIGVVEGEVPYQFSSIGSVVPLSNGDLAVVDEGTAEIRLFSTNGEFLGTLGGLGDGPGEFQRVAALYHIQPDTLVGWDASRLRLQWMSLDGGAHRTLTVDALPGPWLPEVRVLGNGMAVVAAHVVDPRRESADGVYPRADSLAVRVGGTSASSTAIGRFPGVDRALVVRTFGPGMRLTDNVDIPFRYTTMVQAHGDQVIVARNDRPELQFYGANGELQEIWRLPGLLRQLTAEDVAARGVLFSADGGPRYSPDQYQLLLDHYPPPETLPAFEGILSGWDGTVWLAEYRVAVDGPQTWWVLGSDGASIGRVEVPTGLDVRAVENGVVFGVETDELGVERVRRYEFEPLT